MKTNLEKMKTVRHKLHVEVTTERAKKSAEAALKEMQKEVAIKGFRKGQVPLDVLKKHLGGEAEKEIAKRIIKDTYAAAVSQENAAPISDPSVRYESYEEDKPFTYWAEFDVMPEIQVPEYEGLHLEKEKVEVSDDEVESEIKRLQNAMTQLEPADDATLESGMMGLIDFKGTVDGKPFKGSDAENFVVDFGTLLPAFEKKIQGMKKGEERDITVTYPADYFNKEVANKEGSFHVKLKELRKKVVPEINDEFAKTLGKYKDMDEVRSDVKKRIVDAKEEFQKRRLGFAAIRTLVEKNAFEVPDVMVQNELGSMLDELAERLKMQGMTLEKDKFDTKKFIEENLEEAKKRVGGYLIAFAIAKQAEIKVADEDLEKQIAAIARQSKEDVEKVKAHFQKDDLRERLRSQMLYEKTLDFVVGKAKVKEVKPKKAKK